jgi:hypothetical protein
MFCEKLQDAKAMTGSAFRRVLHCPGSRNRKKLLGCAHAVEMWSRLWTRAENRLSEIFQLLSTADLELVQIEDGFGPRGYLLSPPPVRKPTFLRPKFQALDTFPP